MVEPVGVILGVVVAGVFGTIAHAIRMDEKTTETNHTKFVAPIVSHETHEEYCDRMIAECDRMIAGYDRLLAQGNRSYVAPVIAPPRSYESAHPQIVQAQETYQARQYPVMTFVRVKHKNGRIYTGTISQGSNGESSIYIADDKNATYHRSTHNTFEENQRGLLWYLDSCMPD